MTLDRFIYEINLVTTLTTTDNKEWAYILNNNINKEINYTNCVSVYDLALLFNNLYLIFKKEYDKLPKLNLGEDIEIWRHYKRENFRELMLYIWEPNKDICDNYEAFLYLYEDDFKLHSYITNCLHIWNEDYLKKEITIDKSLIKEYLDFGDKHYSLIDSYFILQNKSIISNGTTMLFSKINGNLFNSLSNFETSFGNIYFNSEDYINIIFNLGENFSIDYENSKVIFALKEQTNKKEIIDKLLKSIFINIEKLPNMYKSNNIKKLVKTSK